MKRGERKWAENIEWDKNKGKCAENKEWPEKIGNEQKISKQKEIKGNKQNWRDKNDKLEDNSPKKLNFFQI